MGKIENKYQDDRLELNHIITLNVNVLTSEFKGRDVHIRLNK